MEVGRTEGARTYVYVKSQNWPLDSKSCVRRLVKNVCLDHPDGILQVSIPADRQPASVMSLTKLTATHQRNTTGRKRLLSVKEERVHFIAEESPPIQLHGTCFEAPEIAACSPQAQQAFVRAGLLEKSYTGRALMWVEGSDPVMMSGGSAGMGSQEPVMSVDSATALW